MTNDRPRAAGPGGSDDSDRELRGRGWARLAKEPSGTPLEIELLERCLKGAPGSWEDFLSRYRGVLEQAARGTLRRVLGDAPEDDQEAVVESTLIALVKDNHAALRGFGGRSSLAGYLQAITTKIALNHLRSEGRKGWLRFRPLDSGLEVTEEDSRPKAEEAEGLETLLRSMDQLAPRDRLILKLFHLDGAGYREISSVLGISQNAVSPALIRARERLRALFESGR